LLAIADEVWHDTGAYIRTHGVVVADLTLSMLAGPYRVPAYRGIAHVVLTARTPCGTYRGPGRYEGTFARERLLDVAADELGLDPLDLRRRNLLSPDELPLDRGLSAIGTTMTIDAGDVGGLLERTIAEAGFEGWRDESARLRARGRIVGTGAAVFMEKSGLGPLEHAGVDLLPSGEVRVTAGATSLGQGVETVLATLAAERLDPGRRCHHGRPRRYGPGPRGHRIVGEPIDRPGRERGRPRRRSCRRAPPGGGGRGARGRPRRSPDVGCS
jgi:CO/xanthine dehydrogenase Mo-binding subunit